jgi:DNA-binding FadR family transcriptional regulator
VPRLETVPTRSEQVVDQLRRRIAAGEFPVGTLIPTEAELTLELGVSRNTVREAIKALTHAGMLGARAGYGTFVRETSDVAPTIARRIGDDHPEDVAEVRRLLEAEGARLAALRATPEQHDALRASLAARDAAADGPSYAEADAAFHRLLMDCSGNELLAELYRGMGGNEQGLARHRVPGSPRDLDSAAMRELDHSHTVIVDAVIARDPEAAERAARRTVDLAEDDARDRRTRDRAENSTEQKDPR